MISLLPIGRVIGYIAVAYAFLVVLAIVIVWKLGGNSQGTLGILFFAFTGATALQLALIGWLYIGWKRVWQWFPQLNNLLFPDIGGEWRMEIHWQRQGQEGVVHAKATVKQDFLRVSMEVRSPKSDSQTLIAQPRKDPESGRPILYYVYLVLPKSLGADPGSPYHGAAILKFFDDRGGQLRGNYWTTQHTRGHFRLYRRA
jgi:hypothetical protein